MVNTTNKSTLASQFFFIDKTSCESGLIENAKRTLLELVYLLRTHRFRSNLRIFKPHFPIYIWSFLQMFKLCRSIRTNSYPVI